MKDVQLSAACSAATIRGHRVTPGARIFGLADADADALVQELERLHGEGAARAIPVADVRELFPTADGGALVFLTTADPRGRVVRTGAAPCWIASRFTEASVQTVAERRGARLVVKLTADDLQVLGLEPGARTGAEALVVGWHAAPEL